MLKGDRIFDFCNWDTKATHSLLFLVPRHRSCTSRTTRASTRTSSRSLRVNGNRINSAVPGDDFVFLFCFFF